MNLFANISIKTTHHYKCGMIMVSALTVFFILCSMSFAQDAPIDSSLKPYTLPPDVTTYFKNSYNDKKGKDQVEQVRSRLLETPNGPSGELELSGHIRPKKLIEKPGDKFAHARALAQAFLREEAAFLGLSDLDELHEYEIITSIELDGEYIQIVYERYLNEIPLNEAMIRIEIGPDETITSVKATLIPAGPELYQAATTKTITKEEALKIVRNDLMKGGGYPEYVQILHGRKSLQTAAPYIFWELDVYVKFIIEKWTYTINAVTGKIVRKRNAIMVD